MPEQMENKPAGTEATRVWPSWFLLWVVWVISTTLGWALAGLLTLGMALAFAIPDPDAARAYVSSPLGERIFDGLMLGAMVGLIPALLIALFWVVLRRSARDVVWAVLVTILGSALLCVVGRGGGPQIESCMPHAVRSKRPPDLSPYTPPLKNARQRITRC